MRKIRVAGLALAAAATLGGALLVTHTAGAAEAGVTETSVVDLGIVAIGEAAFNGGDTATVSVQVSRAGTDPINKFFIDMVLPVGISIVSVNDDASVCTEVFGGTRQECHPTAPSASGAPTVYQLLVTRSSVVPDGQQGNIRARVTAIGGNDRVIRDDNSGNNVASIFYRT